MDWLSQPGAPLNLSRTSSLSHRWQRRPPPRVAGDLKEVVGPRATPHPALSPVSRLSFTRKRLSQACYKLPPVMNWITALGHQKKRKENTRLASENKTKTTKNNASLCKIYSWEFGLLGCRCQTVKRADWPVLCTRMCVYVPLWMRASVQLSPPCCRPLPAVPLTTPALAAMMELGSRGLTAGTSPLGTLHGAGVSRTCAEELSATTSER